MSVKILYLNGISNIPNASGEEKLAKANGKKTDNEGLPPSWYRDQGLRPPVSAEEDEPEYDEEGRVILDESDIEEVNVDVAIPLKMFGGCEDLTSGATLVYTTFGYVYTVEETTEEITSYVEYLSMTWWEHKKADFNMFLRRIKIKLGIIKIPAKRIETE